MVWIIPLHSQGSPTQPKKIQHRRRRNKVNSMDATKKPIDVVDITPFVEYVS